MQQHLPHAAYAKYPPRREIELRTVTDTL